MTRAVWEDFTGGDYGKTSPYKVPPNMFKGVNVIVYRDGLLGPRQGLQGTTQTGLPVGVIRGFGWNATSNADLWVTIGTQVWTRGSTIWRQASGALSATPTEKVISVQASNTATYILSPGDGLYRLDHSPDAAGTLTKIGTVTAAMAGRSLAVYNTRLMVGKLDTNVVYYSNAADFNTFSAINYFEVGNNLEVRYMSHQRDALVFIKRDSSIWVMTGVPGLGTLRRYFSGSHPANFFHNFAVQRSDGTIFALSNVGGWPVTFDGAQVQDLRYLQFMDLAQANSDAQVVRIDARDSLLFLSNLAPDAGTGFQFINGAWVPFSLGQTVSAYTAEMLQNIVWFTDGGAAGTAAVFWSLNQTPVDKPGNGDGTTTQMTASVTLAPYSSPDGQDVRVRQVIVDYKAWNTGGALDANLTVTVNAQRREGSGDVISSAPQSATIPQGSLPTTGKYFRFVANVGDQGDGSSFEITLTALRSVAIARVTAVMEPIGEGPRT